MTAHGTKCGPTAVAARVRRPESPLAPGLIHIGRSTRSLTQRNVVRAVRPQVLSPRVIIGGSVVRGEAWQQRQVSPAGERTPGG